MLDERMEKRKAYAASATPCSGALVEGDAVAGAGAQDRAPGWPARAEASPAASAGRRWRPGASENLAVNLRSRPLGAAPGRRAVTWEPARWAELKRVVSLIG